MTAMRSAREFSATRSLDRRGFVLCAPLIGAALTAYARQETEIEAGVPVALVQGSSRVDAIRMAWGMLAAQGLQGKDVYVKASYNSAHQFPASTHPDALRTLVALLREGGCGRITLIERSGMGATRDVWQSLGVPSLARELDLQTIALDELPAGQWSKRVFAGSHWKHGFEVPRFLEEGSPVVQLCNLKTHRFGGHFSASMKNALGVLAKYSHSGEDRNYMAELHGSPDQRLMIAEACQAFSPTVSIMDAMQVFVSEGPERGELAAPGVIAASGDRIALDSAGIALLRLYNAVFPGKLKDVFEQEQIKRAVELGLGVSGPDRIRLMTRDAASETLAVQLRALMADIKVDEEKS
jgi:uncharacterized protein (DUF362 family)